MKSLLSSPSPVCLLMNTFFGGIGLAEVEEGDSGETLACADDAHKAVVYT